VSDSFSFFKAKYTGSAALVIPVVVAGLVNTGDSAFIIEVGDCVEIGDCCVGVTTVKCGEKPGVPGVQLGDIEVDGENGNEAAGIFVVI